MSRGNTPRRVGFLPHNLSFKPVGVKAENLEEVVLGNDELEAIRLKDLLGMSQGEAAREMQISQPTFHRLILTARQKVADAFVNGKAVRIDGGNINVEEDFSQPCHWRKRWGCKAKTACEDEVGETPGRVQGGRLTTIAITSTDGTLDGMVDERFGRARKIILYHKENESFEVMDNTAQMNMPQGAGIETARIAAKSPAQVVISGHLGPNAFRILETARILAYSAPNMTVREALRKFEQGELTKLVTADVTGHWGKGGNGYAER
jgi:predicted DNA-binding protein (UPF0251 family)/predicted Fe-Mo cluster-binding NifX family protein